MCSSEDKLRRSHSQDHTQKSPCRTSTCGVLGPLIYSPFRSPPHSLSPRSPPVKYHSSLASIVCTFNTIFSEPKPLKTKLKESPPYVCIYVSMHVVWAHMYALSSHACSVNEGGCHMFCSIIFLITLKRDLSLNPELFWHPASPGNPFGLSPQHWGYRDTGAIFSFLHSAWDLNSGLHAWTARALTHLPNPQFLPSHWLLYRKLSGSTSLYPLSSVGKYHRQLSYTVAEPQVTDDL